MINIFTRAEITVMARCTGHEINDTRIMIKGARGEGTRGMTNTAIRGGRKMSGRFTEPRTITGISMTGFAEDDTGVVEYTAGKIAASDTMTHTAIVCCCHMSGQGRLSARIDTIAVIMTISARLYSGINTVVEHAAKIEAGARMTDTTIDGHDRMTDYWSRRIGAIMTASTIVRDATVVRIGIFKTGYRVTESAIVI